MFSWFINFKTIIIGIITALVGGYVIKQKITAARAESKLQDIEIKIAKTNIVVAKQVAESKAESKDIETTTEIETLKELTIAKKEALKEIDDITKIIADTQKEKVATKSRTRSADIEIEI